MSQLSLSLYSSLLVRDDQGRYLPATADQILEAARYVIDQKIPRGTLFTSPALVKDYLRTKLASFEHEVFAALFLDSQNRLIEYVEMFRGKRGNWLMNVSIKAAGKGSRIEISPRYVPSKQMDLNSKSALVADYTSLLEKALQEKLAAAAK